MRRHHLILTAAAIAVSFALVGCETADVVDKLTDLIPFGDNKKPLPGERKEVFPQGVPGVPQGVPPDMVKGNQPPPDATPPPQQAVAPPPEKPKPKKKMQAKPKAPPQPPKDQSAQTVPPTQQMQPPQATSTWPPPMQPYGLPTQTSPAAPTR
jgi:outer membrane biosynthesis protein TonB